jgi:ubiquinone/menaquinone biosynthesis C-methylase UbiE
MTDQTERYDRIAAGYARWWAPFLAPAVGELVDEVTPRASPWASVLDLGTGTGQLALAAIERWPNAAIVGVDASVGMLALANDAADARLDPGRRARFETVTAMADELPFDDGSFDAVISSFVLQLVPNRARALREARRVLRPDGHLAYVSWLDDDRQFRPDTMYDDLLDELGLEARWSGGRSGDIPTVERAAGELRRAGFAGASARRGTLRHRFTVEGYLAFLTEFDEESYLGELDRSVRDRLVGTLRDRLERLSDADMTMTYPIVFASGRRSR